MKSFIIVLFLLMTSHSVHAWTVEQIQGESSLKSEGHLRPLKIGQILKTDESVVTGRDGRVRLMDGNSEIWVSSNTEFKLDEPIEQAKKKLAVLQILKGKVRARFEKSAGETEAPFKVKMRSVVCGVRGTEFFAAVGAEDEKVCTLEGHVVVASLNDANAEWELPAGKGLFLTSGHPAEVKDTSAELVRKWVSETSAISFYSLPWQLRAVVPSDSFRVDSALAFFSDRKGNNGGTASASMLTGSYRLQERYALVARLGITNVSPPSGAPSGTSYSNPLLAVSYAPEAVSHLRSLFFFGMTLPLGAGGGNAPDAGTRNANLDGALARSAMDNALFAVNYFAFIPGVDFAYIENGLTVQLEATLFQLYRAKGEQVDQDASRTNFTSGLEFGYEFAPDISMIGELHYQRWLANDTVFASSQPAVENLSFAVGPRFNVRLGDAILKPGISYERGLVGPMVSGGFSSPANSEQILFVDLPVVF